MWTVETLLFFAFGSGALFITMSNTHVRVRYSSVTVICVVHTLQLFFRTHKKADVFCKL